MKGFSRQYKPRTAKNIAVTECEYLLINVDKDFKMDLELRPASASTISGNRIGISDEKMVRNI